MISKVNKNQDRKKRHTRVRLKISGTAECPRLCVYRSLNNIYAQIIDDVKGTTLVACSTVEKEVMKLVEGKSKKEAAKIVGGVDSPRAPYVVLGPPAVFIIDPVSGELIKSLFTKSEVDKYGKPLAGIIEEAWNNHVNRKKLN